MESSDIELWGGVECTVNRVGEVFFDQVERTGHAERIEDLNRLADLGIRAVRYPILWERTVRHGLTDYDFSWADARLARLRELGIRVIGGLVHHGSGPLGTNLLDESFVSGLAHFARAVAERYPWIQDFTPVNEPLTTARFSALYGHWYPHTRDAASFLKALMIQTRATASSMRAIRSVTPAARLVQTEDFGSVFCTPKLRYQADFENLRKWLSLDLLFGRVTRRHPLYRYLIEHGAVRTELQAMEQQPCPPDLIGVNYYVTSDRFLDDRVSRYPASVVGTNGRHRYADVEAVRVRRKGIVGHREVLATAWARYRKPLAITEVHLGCTPEEQVRWLREAWHGARSAKDSGVDVRAVTLWSAFGAYDWDSLATLPRGHYEPGAYDVRGPTPRATALARVASDLARFGKSSLPILESHGWWRCASRFLHQASPMSAPKPAVITSRARPVLIVGLEGPLAEAFRSACEERNLHVRTLLRTNTRCLTPQDGEEALEALNPWLVVNASGVLWFTPHVDTTLPFTPDALAAAYALAQACRRRGTKLVAFSSALVYHGEKLAPYVESDVPNPTCELGKSHARLEAALSEIHTETLLVRAGALFDTSAHSNRLWDSLRRVSLGELVTADHSCHWSLAFAPELAHTCLDLAMAHVSGSVHLSHGGTYTMYDFLRKLADSIGIETDSLAAAHHEPCGVWRHLPPSFALASERVPPLSDLRECIARVGEIVRSSPELIRSGLAA